MDDHDLAPIGFQKVEVTQQPSKWFDEQLAMAIGHHIALGILPSELDSVRQISKWVVAKGTESQRNGWENIILLKGDAKQRRVWEGQKNLENIRKGIVTDGMLASSNDRRAKNQHSIIMLETGSPAERIAWSSLLLNNGTEADKNKWSLLLVTRGRKEDRGNWGRKLLDEGTPHDRNRWSALVAEKGSADDKRIWDEMLARAGDRKAAGKWFAHVRKHVHNSNEGQTR